MCLRILLGCLLLFSFPLGSIAQKQEKPSVLVYGADVIALNAAVQSARSNVPTLWVLDQDEIAGELTSAPLSLHGNQRLDGGLWLEMLMDMAMSKQRSDSLAGAVKKSFNPRLARNAIEKILDKLPNLTVVKGTSISKAERRRKGWRVTLSNKQTYQVIAMIDASNHGDLVALQERAPVDSSQQKIPTVGQLELAESRTTVAVGEWKGTLRVVLLSDLLHEESDNLFDIGDLRSAETDPESIPFRSAVGQALGATAGYCAFFKTTTNRIDIRKLQSELLAFRARLNPYQDVSVGEPHFSALQKFYLTGFFMGKPVGQEYHLDKEQPVRLEEVREVLNTIHTRSQLWFLDHGHQGEMTWADLMELTKFVSFKGDEITRQVQDDWQRKLDFEGSYDPQQAVSREQFAVITDLFSDAFAKAINLDGSFVK